MKQRHAGRHPFSLTPVGNRTFSLLEAVLAMGVFAVFAAGWYATVEASLARQRNMERQFEALVLVDNVVERLQAASDCGVETATRLLDLELARSGLPRDAVTVSLEEAGGEAVLSVLHDTVGPLVSVRIPIREGAR